MKKKAVKKKVVKKKREWRDLTVTKKCEGCGKKYHPDRTYIATSRFCSQVCARKEVKKKSVSPYPIFFNEEM